MTPDGGGRRGRGDGAPPVFYADGPLVAGGLVTLGEDAAHHARVRRLEEGDAVAIRDGAGRAAAGRLTRLARGHAVVELSAVTQHASPPPLHLLAPVGDRDRMLWAAEKAVEIGIASWRPVVWSRSRSVAARGEGGAFQQKVRARMIAALTQSGATWLPELHPDAPAERALAAAPIGTRVVLHPDGAPLAALALAGAVSLAVGPEGGFEDDELERLDLAGFRRARLPGNILRFETACVAGLAVAHSLVERAGAPSHATEG